MNSLLVISVVCITLFALLGLFLVFTKRGNKTANRLLGAFFFFWAIDFFDGALMLQGFYLDFPNLALWTESFIFLYGPIIYLYTRQSLFPEAKLKWTDLYHGIPFLIGLLGLIVVFHIQSTELKLSVLQSVLELEQSWSSFGVFLLIYVHFFYYIFKSKSLLAKTIRELKSFYTNFNYSWLDNLLSTLAVVLLISLVNTTLQFSGLRQFFEISLLIVQILVGGILAYMIFKALERPEDVLLIEKTEKYAGSRMSKSDSEALALKISKSLEQQKLYLDPELTLGQLANTLGSSKRDVSQAINEHMGKSFFDLVNGYRIEAAKRIFSSNNDPKLTILEVMYEVGFNSKSSFNTQFKNKTGLTPTEFLKSSS